MSIKVGKSFKALIAAGAALVMAASMAACGPSAGTPSEAKSSDTGTSSSANAKARSLDEIKKSGKIKIAVFSDKAPFGYVDKDGKYQAMTSTSPNSWPRIWVWSRNTRRLTRLPCGRAHLQQGRSGARQFHRHR